MDSPIHGTEEIETWEEVKIRVEQLVKALPRSSHGETPKVLFRGQEDARLTLTTTLQRTGGIKQIYVTAYYALAYSVRAEVALEGDVPVSVLELEKVKSILSSAYDLRLTPLPELEYLIYLRHHGFPSPLLDWTRDLYTAALFAYKNSKFAGARSICVYCEFPNWVKGGWRALPRIFGLGHQISQLKRHKKQLAEYTVCVSLNSPQGRWTFSEHEAVLSLKESDQDSLMRIVIPGSEGDIIRTELDNRGIGADVLLPPVELDKCMERLVEQVFGPSGLAQSLKLR